MTCLVEEPIEPLESPLKCLRVIFCAFSIAQAIPIWAEDSIEQTQSAHTAIQRSIPFLLQEGTEWIEERGCVSCHQVPFMVWSLNAATQCGFEIDSNRLDELKSWAVDIQNFDNPTSRENRTDAERASSNTDTMAQMLLALRGDATETPEWVTTFETALIENQESDGTWKACGQLPGQKRPITETHEVTTIWTLLAVLESTHETLPDNIDQTMSVLAESGESTEWWAVRLLLAARQNDSQLKKALQDRLRGFQHIDGGWGWLTSEESDAFGTGLAMYALLQTGMSANDAMITNAKNYLLATQSEEGSWPVKSTKSKNKTKVTPTATYWGTAWAIIGLCESISSN